MKIPLIVKYEEREEAKSNGAQWDAKNKSWYLWDYKKLPNVKKWLNLDYNIYITEKVYLVNGYRNCWKCNNETIVYSIGADKLAMFDEEHESWKHYSTFYLFQYIELYSDKLMNILDFTNNIIKLIPSKTFNCKYLMNTCEHCHAVQGDNYLYDEVDSVFSPNSESDITNMTIKKIPLELDIGIKGSLFWSNNNGRNSNAIIWNGANHS